MKTFLKLSLLASLCCLLVISCNKDEELKLEPNLEEGLKSATGDKAIACESNTEPIKSEVVFRKSYSKDLSVEETDALWNQEMSNLQLPSLKMARATEWFQTVRVCTGTQKFSDTDGDVYYSINYRTDVGNYSTSVLDDSGENKGKGEWDYFLVRSYIPGKSVSWIELTGAWLCLKGTNGWYVTRYIVSLTGRSQIIPASGGSYINSYPNVWLDNTSTFCWDCYYTGNIGYGRLSF